MRLKHIIFCFIVFISSACSEELELNYQEYFEVKKEVLKAVPGNPVFFYFTDTHISDNTGNSPYIINEFAKYSECRTVIWGGDAITAYSPSIHDEWEKQERMFETIAPVANVYTVHGNHDLTNKNRKSNNGFTFPHKKLHDLLLKNCKSIVRNNSDSSSCYYYFDDDKHRLRYVVVDTNDKGIYGDKAWGYDYSISKKQIEWLANEAFLTTPDNYGIFVLSHVPILRNFNGFYPDFEKMLHAVKNKSIVNIDCLTFDFRMMGKNTKLLAIISGHNHHDMQVFSGGLLQVIVASDACYQDFKRSPFAFQSTRKKNTISEQVVELCKYDDNENVLSFVRFGYGSSRYFHLNPIVVKEGDWLNVPFIGADIKNIGFYDADAKYVNKEWTLRSNVLSVESNGKLRAKSKGEAVVFSVNAKGDLELFDVVVK